MRKLAVLLLLAGCSTPKKTPAPASLTVDDDDFEFDPFPGRESDAQVFTFTNQGGVATQALETHLLGPGLDSFMIVADSCAGKPLAPGTRCTVSVAVRPAVAGLLEAQLRVEDADLVARVRLLAAGVEAALAPSPSPIALGDVYQGESGTPVDWVVTNVGNLPSGTLTVTATGAITTVDPCSGTTLAPGASCTVSVSHNAALGDAPVGGSGKLALSAEPGGSAEVDVTWQVIVPNLLVVHDLDFGDVEYASYPEQKLTVTFVGPGESGPLTPTYPTSGDLWLGYGGPDDTCTGKSLPVGKSCTLPLEPGFPLSTVGQTLHAAVSLSAPNAKTASAQISVHAVKNQPDVELTVNGSSHGSVALDGKYPLLVSSCMTGDCISGAMPVVAGSQPVLTAIAQTGFVVGSWSVARCGHATMCKLDPVNADVQVSVTFQAQ